MAASERRCLLGGPGTGKTGRLVERAAGLLEAGAAPGDVLVVAGPAARATFVARLAERVGAETAARVRIETPCTLELGLLDCDAARAHTGRRARLLQPFEVNVLLEDVKTSGVRPGRLKQMLKFFYRGWTELADADPAWLVTDEERGVYRLLKECLAFSGGIMDAELAGLAVGWLRADAASLAAAQVPHVLVDDYQMLNRASQTLAEMLAGASLTVAGDPRACVEVGDPYPCAAGLEAFAQADGVVVERLGACGRGGELGEALVRLQGAIDATDRAVAAERAEEELQRRAVREMRTPDEQRAFEAERGCGDGDEGEKAGPASTGGVPKGSAPTGGAPVGVGLRAYSTVADEARAVAELVQEALAGGMLPQDVFVAAPTRSYAASVRRALASRGIACARTAETRFLAVDVRDLRRCTAARAITLLELAADPTDDVAWRSWCGFGDWLANSPGFSALRRLAVRAALPLHDLLERLARDDMPERGRAQAFLQSLAADERASLGRVLDAYATARSALDGLAGLEGRDLVEKAVRCVAGAGGEAETGVEADAAAALRAVLALTGGDAGDDANGDSDDGVPTGGVGVGVLEEAAGRDPRLLVVVGLVDGLAPGKDYFDEVQSSPLHRLQVLAGDQRRLYAALGACRDDVRLTTFERVEQAVAMRMGLRVRRVRAVGGEPFACTYPSVLLGELGLGLGAAVGAV